MCFVVLCVTLLRIAKEFGWAALTDQSSQARFVATSTLLWVMLVAS